MMGLFLPLEKETIRTLESFSALTDKVFPIPERFHRDLPKDVAELSRLLTNSRGERHESYLNKPAMLSAYLRYFLPWNLYRLCSLLPGLSLGFNAGDAITDLGSGPLTLLLALWISRPDLRNTPLEVRCVDRSASVLDAGKKLFSALAGEDSVWRIKTIRADIGSEIRGEKSVLVSALNVFNERFLDIPHNNSGALSVFAEKSARLLDGLISESGTVLVVEPGIPRCGEFISFLRSAFINRGFVPRFPCSHTDSCPFSGGKNKWCHFTLETFSAPKSLLKLSADAKLPKERAGISFLSVTRQVQQVIERQPDERLAVRVISDAFPINVTQKRNVFGRYGCSARGMILVTGEKLSVEREKSGALLMLDASSTEKRDAKTGALILEIT